MAFGFVLNKLPENGIGDVLMQSNKELLERATKIIPRGCQAMSKCASMWPSGEYFPLMVESENGCEMIDIRGRKFINLMSGSGPAILGANDRDVERAIKEQLKNGVCFSLPIMTEIEFGEYLRDDIYKRPDLQVKYCSNGTDAVSGAIRAARSYARKTHILINRKSYHGWSDSIAAASDRNCGIPEDLKQYIGFCDYNNLQQLEDELKTGKYACFLQELVSLEEPNEGYLAGVQELCHKYGAIWIADEVITGLRWSICGAAGMYNVEPDLTCLGKAISGGLPLAAVIGKEEYMKEFENIFFSGTNFGSPISIAAGFAAVKKLNNLKDKIYPHIWKQGNRFKKAFDYRCKELSIDARMVGMAPRLNVKFNYSVCVKDLFYQEMIKHGIFIGTQIYTTWAIKKHHMDKIITASNESLEIVASAIKDGTDKYLEGKPSIQIFNRR